MPSLTPEHTTLLAKLTMLLSADRNDLVEQGISLLAALDAPPLWEFFAEGVSHCLFEPIMEWIMGKLAVAGALAALAAAEAWHGCFTAQPVPKKLEPKINASLPGAVSSVGIART